MARSLLPPVRRGGLWRALGMGLLALSVAVQLFVLYRPRVGGTPPFPYADKVVHLVIFALPVVLAVAAGLGVRAVAVVAAAHAPVSETIQHFFVEGRSGDVADVAADLVGVGVGILVVWGVHRLGIRDRQGATLSMTMRTAPHHAQDPRGTQETALDASTEGQSKGP